VLGSTIKYQLAMNEIVTVTETKLTSCYKTSCV